MTYSLDPEIYAEIIASSHNVAATTLPEPGDWEALRRFGVATWETLSRAVAAVDGVDVTHLSIPTRDGTVIEGRWYVPHAELPRSAVVYLHGGGMIVGTLDDYDPIVRQYVAATRVPFLAVGYRLAPESKGKALAYDCFAGLQWLHEHASELGIAAGRIAVMGDSAGGGLAASVAILGRDNNVPVCRQILIYPMLDDRTTVADPLLLPVASWSYDFNLTAWTCVLGERCGSGQVSPVEAAGRLTNFASLPPAYIEVGDLDIFRFESLAFAGGLMSAGVPVELHVHANAPHAYDRIAQNSGITRRAMRDRHRVIAAL